MNQGSFLFIAAAIGFLAYRKASQTGWKAAIGGLVLSCVLLTVFLWFPGSEVWSDLRKRPDAPKIMFFVTLAFMGTIFLADEILRRKIHWNLMPRHVGLIAFFGIYALLNVAFFVLRLKETS